MIMHEQIKNINTLEELQALYTATYGKNGTMTLRLKAQCSPRLFDKAQIH